jgi:DNA-binding GntR family transcriptional regulator
LKSATCTLLLLGGIKKMIQKCKVTYHNKFLNIIVFEFKGKEIQMTLDIPDETKVVYIKHENGKYSAASEQEYNNSKISTKNVQKIVKGKPLEKSE